MALGEGRHGRQTLKSLGFIPLLWWVRWLLLALTSAVLWFLKLTLFSGRDAHSLGKGGMMLCDIRFKTLHLLIHDQMLETPLIIFWTRFLQRKLRLEVFRIKLFCLWCLHLLCLLKVLSCIGWMWNGFFTFVSATFLSQLCHQLFFSIALTKIFVHATFFDKLHKLRPSLILLTRLVFSSVCPRLFLYLLIVVKETERRRFGHVGIHASTLTVLVMRHFGSVNMEYGTEWGLSAQEFWGTSIGFHATRTSMGFHVTIAHKSLLTQVSIQKLLAIAINSRGV